MPLSRPLSSSSIRWKNCSSWAFFPPRTLVGRAALKPTPRVPRCSLPLWVLSWKPPPSDCGGVHQIQTLIIDQARAEQVPESSDSLFTYLIERVRNNLHIVLCLSPVGDPFR